MVPDSETKEEGEVYYLPHRAVIRHDKEKIKLHMVYDASAKSGGPSLNDCLHTGPKFNQYVFDILLRFRSYQVALTADIEKAFLMISIDKRDRDALRFFCGLMIFKEGFSSCYLQIGQSSIWSLLQSIFIECDYKAPPREVLLNLFKFGEFYYTVTVC